MLEDCVDFHCHIDLFRDPTCFLEKLDKSIKLVAMTTTPLAFKQNCIWAQKYNIFPSLGLHPQIVDTKYANIIEFLKLLPKTDFVGEIGLDKSLQYKHTFDKQLEYFCQIVGELKKINKKIVSIHSLRAAEEVLTILQNNINTSNVYILHWYTGNYSQIKIAIKLGVYFSINNKMLISKNGSNIIAHLPIDKILLESDAPFANKTLSKDYYADLIHQISIIKHMDFETTKMIIHRNAQQILAFLNKNSH